MDRIRNIEFLRVFGCLVIIFFHFFNKEMMDIVGESGVYAQLYRGLRDGQKAVDLFFILSGVFFALTTDTTKPLWDFVKKKVIRLWPVMIFAMCLAFIFSVFGWLKFNLYTNILCILGLTGTGLSLDLGNIGLFWYVSALMWTMVLLYFLLQNCQRKYVYFLIGCAVFFCYSFLIHAKGGKINHNVQTFGYIFNVGMMRAIAGVGLGYLIGEWYRQYITVIQNWLPNMKAKLVLTMLELACMSFLVRHLIYKPNVYKNDVMFIVAFAAIIILFLMNKGYVSQFFDRQIWVRMAQYTFACYITHSIILRSFRNSIFCEYTDIVMVYPTLMIMIGLVLVIVVGVFTYHFVEVPAKRYLTKLDREYTGKNNSSASPSL